MFGRPNRDALFGFPPELEAREAVAEIHRDLIRHIRSILANTAGHVDREGLSYALDEACQQFETNLLAVLKAWTK